MITPLKHQGWNALKLSTAEAELIVPTEIGPRVTHLALKGGDNLFAELKEQSGGKGEADWCIRGGHRLWHTPEKLGRTYQPDNEPIEVETMAHGLNLKQAVEPATGLRKTVRIEVVNERTFKVTHTLTNQNVWPVEFGAWALSVMKGGGYAALPLPPAGIPGQDLLPTYALVPWSYTDLSQPCWQFHPRHLGIDTSKTKTPQKVGMRGWTGWAAYWQPAGTFVVHAPRVAGAVYPDFGCEFEAYHCDWMCEMETLGPIGVVEAGASVSHVEFWGLIPGLPKPDNDTAFRAQLAPAAEAWLKGL